MSQQQDFPVEVEGIGTFHFAKRTMRHEFRIQAEYSRLTEGVETPTPQLEIMAGVFSQLRVLTVTAPAGWDLDEMDPLDEDAFAKLLRVHAAMRAKEQSFRRGPQNAGEGARQGDGGDAGVRVPPPVQPGTD